MARRAATCARAAPSRPFIDLILQEFAGLIEQIDRDQPVREPPDHFVAAPPDRRQFTIFVEHPERVDRRKVVALRAQKQLREQRRRRILTLPRWLGIGLQPGRGPCRRKGFAVAPRSRDRSAPSLLAPSPRPRRRATSPKAFPV